MTPTHPLDCNAPRNVQEIGLTPDNIDWHPDLTRKHDRDTRERLIGEGVIVPAGAR